MPGAANTLGNLSRKIVKSRKKILTAENIKLTPTLNFSPSYKFEKAVTITLPTCYLPDKSDVEMTEKDVISKRSGFNTKRMLFKCNMVCNESENPTIKWQILNYMGQRTTFPTWPAKASLSQIEPNLDKLKQLFEGLGCAVREEPNLSAEELRKTIKSFLKNDQHTDFCVLFIVSHGENDSGKDVVFGKDGESLTILKIVDCFFPAKCSSDLLDKQL
ncbi:unnamed protein product [Clavelina lepadiformis]|uniref:Caspase family p20 domain-containing protein n=1 Tax=Clavelina lepadiformis TaxID=159417 RepID=A0ABP0GES8_CLALP